MNKQMMLLSSLFQPSHNGKVKFILKGTAGDYNITFKNNDDHAFQVPHARKSWKYSFTAHEGDYVYFSAQANEPASEVYVKILYDGKVFKESRAKGDFAVAFTGGCLC
ncbi:MAG: hypothetical protein IPH88_10800 [Bacteroidales bacterium]|nr:hypothetical protein [Bacteroidales bacterium]